MIETLTLRLWTSGFTVAGHVRVIAAHLGPIVSDVLVTTEPVGRTSAGRGPVAVDVAALRRQGIATHHVPLLSRDAIPGHHDPELLADAVSGWLGASASHRRPARAAWAGAAGRAAPETGYWPTRKTTCRVLTLPRRSVAVTRST
jgi:hypothetical protein